ncbi:bifunctional (p)ppGpp synthetase/guanosine-3',5'-bis(diphosphate) 3'-pyrophosphohydrolase [Acetobacterium sp. KB-1]|jgi:GTP pyrophosphokinase|uniref:RelA/SpoT family protein n=1 Tax=Acetobacterium sp. KB-1 TaxID=2184575 RepID=UPI000DBEB2BE|nr:bifunctional (p)ppGpp synthetase/guanosine-3',5'-bis(diphosphate) 3'-pyrophosphohydrolase [Acetobacterium sp. KB-1]AWW25344.1 (p)ppGpp synthetase [Acetobacterium sp. KB-1]
MDNDAVKGKIDNVINLVKANNPDAETDMINKAYDLAREAHKDQKRLSGEDYVIHPVSVAYILAEMQMDTETIVAAILHDVIEDTIYSYDYIKEEFNEDIADLVEGVTKIGRIGFQSKEESQAENLRKMILAMSKDIRVILIKLVDRLHNMRTLEYMREAKQLEKAKETLDIYAPLANRLGISTIKWELEDLALKYLDPEGYYDLVQKIKIKKSAREAYIADVIDVLAKEIDKVGTHAEIYGRSKHFYSIYRKMKNQNRSFDEIYDLIAVRVIVDSLKDCYGVLGVVHSQWTPIPGRFKDYIAMPKPNLYQSIHTTVMGPKGEPFEIQIRTREMHETAEYGIAAHWKYKEGRMDAKDNKYEVQMSWLRQMLELQRNSEDAGELVETIKVDLLNEEVYVFSPKGAVVPLPAGSCPLDFAYRIHSDIGNSCVGARVNNKIVPLNSPLKSGDIVEVMTSKNSNGPSRDWLTFVKSAHARNKIKQYFKKEEKDENVQKGRSILEREIKREGLQHSNLLNLNNLELLAEKCSFKNLNDFYAAIGYNGIKIGTVFQKMKLLFPKEFPEEVEEIVLKKPTKDAKKTSSTVIVAGHNEIDVHFAKCCNPVPGDKIVGYITKGRGISVHRADCSNVLNLTDPNRIVEVEWNKYSTGSFTAEIHIKAKESPGTIIQISKTFLDMGIPVTALNAKNEKNEYDFFSATLEVKSRRELNLLIKNLNKIKEIIQIYRV